MLQTEPDWQQCLADAIGRRDALQKLADDERRAGADYLRPLVLIQSEPRRFRAKNPPQGGFFIGAPVTPSS